MTKRSLLLALALALVACRSDDKPPQRPAPAPRIAAPDAPAAADAEPVSDAAIADEPGPGDVLLTDDKQAIHLRWGRAFYGADGFIVQLYSMRKACEAFSPLDNDFTGSRVQFTLLPGPGGRFYTGQRFGTDVLVQSDVIPLILTPPQVELAIAPFRTGKGQHIRGTIDAREHMLIGSAALEGAFDVEICDGPDEPVRALRAVAPPRAASGTFAGAPLAPRTVHAIVRAHSASNDEAIDVSIHRKARGSLDYIWMLVFYAKPNVPCPPPDEDFGADPPPLIYFQGPSGGATTRPILHAPQPVGGTSGEQSWTGWVAFDHEAFAAGERVTGTLWAQPMFAWSPRGEFGGRFTAIVCVE